MELHPSEYDNNLLFDDAMTPEWQDHWQNMPEYISEEQKEVAAIIVRFRTEDDLKEFCAIVNQDLKNTTKSMWYPELEGGVYSNKRYVDLERSCDHEDTKSDKTQPFAL